MAAELDLSQLRKTYTRRRQPPVLALQGLDLHLAGGELVGLLGPSGCGKSTTLRMIAGLEDVTSGDIAVDGRSLLGLPPGQRGVGVAFENYALYPPLSVRDNVRFGLHARREAEIDRRVDEIAERLDLGSILDERPGGLSSGDKQRVALARALARAPKVLLLDEPLSHLDAGQREQTRRELKRLQRDTGYTTILVTHDQQEAVSMADRIVVMEGGRIRQVGTVDEVYDDPANLFVAGFVGEPAMNLLPARLAHDDGSSVLDLGGRTHLRVERLVGDGGRHVVAGVRPADLEVVAAPGDEVMSGELRSAEDLLELNRGILALPGVDDTVLFETVTDVALEPGETAHLRPHPGRVYVFDADTGERIRPAGPALEGA